MAKILEQNGDKDFVKRIRTPKTSPSIDLGNGEHASHKMEWGEADGEYYVYPRIMRDDKDPARLRDYGKGAFDEALKRKEFIKFKTPHEADWFSRRYKAAWGH